MIVRVVKHRLIVHEFKPKGTLKAEDKYKYKTKIELASEIITELIEEGFNIELKPCYASG
jgi:SRSO17 transposase